MATSIRKASPKDHKFIVEVMPKWWGGRDLSSSLLKICFIHFRNTCFVAEENGKLVGFLVGFISQSYNNEAYIHLAGINPESRRKGIGKSLYNKFFSVCKKKSVFLVKSCTSPVNKLSISFHQGMGFEIMPGDGIVDGCEVTKNYLREGHHNVLFQIKLKR